MDPKRSRLAAIAAGALVLGGAEAGAVDWSVSGFFSQRFEADSNIDQSADDEQGAVGAIANFGVVLRARTPIADWTLSPGFRAAVYGGPGATSDLDGLLPRFNGSMTLRAADDHTVTASLAVVPDNSTTTQFERGDPVEENVLQITVSGDLGWRYEATPRDAFSLGAFTRVEEYVEDPETLSPSRRFGARAGWERGLDTRTTATLDATVTQFISDGDDDEDSLSYEMRGGFSRIVTPRLTLGASAGASLTSTEGGGGEDDDLFVGFVGGFDLTYAGRDTTYTLSASQSVDQNSRGDVENFASLTADVSHTVNNWSRIGLRTRLGLQRPLDSDSEEDDRWTLSVSPTYTVSITRDWDASLGYALRASSDGDGEAISNLVFVEFSRGLSFLP